MQAQARHVCLQCWMEGSSKARTKLANLAASRAVAGPSRSITNSPISVTSVDASYSVASSSSSGIEPAPEEAAPAAGRARFQRFPDSPSQRPSTDSHDTSNGAKGNGKGKGKGKISLTELLLAARPAPEAPATEAHRGKQISPEQDPSKTLDGGDGTAADSPSKKPSANATNAGKPAGKKPLTRKAKAKARAAAKRKQGSGADKANEANAVTAQSDVDEPIGSGAAELGAGLSTSVKAKSVRARRKAPLHTKGRKKAHAEPSSSLGSDSLRPTSESGFTVTPDPFGSILPEDKKAVATRMEELMRPLFAECLKLDGPEQEKEVRTLRKVLEHYILQYRRLRKQGARARVQERFIREVLQESRWIPGRAEEVEDERSAGETVIAGSTVASGSDAEKTKSVSLGRISASDIKIAPIAPPHGHVEVASLAHGLERVLFQSGTHWLQDPRTSTYNYPKSCESIPKIADFDFDRLPRFMKPSSDPDLALLLKSSGKKFAGSTSSLTSALSQIYFALNGTKPLNTQSQSFVDQPREFSAGIRLPASVILNMTEEGNYIIDADKSADIGAADNPLSEKGHILEKLLTHTPAEFERFLKASTNPLQPEESRDKREAYHYSSTSSLLMRSQLDCHDDRLPRKTFDIKTRGSIALRRDMLNHLSASGYQITSLTGHLSSFEREKYDLIRSAFLKYSMQVRIGAMDGIFLAYHSGEQIFGFEYLPLEELDKFISGSFEESQQAFQLCLGTLEAMLERAVTDIPGKSLRLSFEGYRGALQVYAQPLNADVGSEPIRQPAELPRGVTPADAHTPLILYDVLINNSLNGEPIKHGKPVDFATIRADETDEDDISETDEDDISTAAAELAQEEDVEGAVQGGQEALADEIAAEDAISEPETAFASAFEEVMSSTTGETAKPAAAESAPSPRQASPTTTPAIEWSITLDVAQSTDHAFNYSRLERLRKRQSKFSAGVVLPEGLTSAEEARALRGAQTPEEEEAFRKEGEDGHAWNGGTFIPRFGVTYTKRKYGIIGELRRLNKVGRAKMDAAQGRFEEVQA